MHQKTKLFLRHDRVLRAHIRRPCPTSPIVIEVVWSHLGTHIVCQDEVRVLSGMIASLEARYPGDYGVVGHIPPPFPAKPDEED